MFENPVVSFLQTLYLGSTSMSLQRTFTYRCQCGRALQFVLLTAVFLVQWVAVVSVHDRTILSNGGMHIAEQEFYLPNTVEVRSKSSHDSHGTPATLIAPSTTLTPALRHQEADTPQRHGTLPLSSHLVYSQIVSSAI